MDTKLMGLWIMYYEIQRLIREGMSYAAISTMLVLNSRTVRKYGSMSEEAYALFLAGKEMRSKVLSKYDEASAPTDREHHFPVKISFFSSQADLLDDPDLINQLIDQVYQFSRMYWKSVSQQNLPVTIKYPEMVAEIFPYFTHDKLPDHGKESLWFL